MNLYRLELRKIRLSVYLRAAAGICAALLSMGLMFLFIFQSEGVTGPSAAAEPYGSWNGLLALTAALAFSCFSVLSAVLAARLIVGEYCGKYAVLLLCECHCYFPGAYRLDYGCHGFPIYRYCRIYLPFSGSQD